MRFPLPSDTAVLASQAFKRCRNLGLFLDKLRPINNDTDEKGNAWDPPSDQWRITEQAKHRGDCRLCFSKPVPDLLKAANARRASFFTSLGSRVRTFTAEPEYRLVVGFGAEHVLETSLFLHRIYGFPIVPGSAVKGVARARAFWEIAEGLGLECASAAGPTAGDTREKTPLQLLDLLLSEGSESKQQMLLEKLSTVPALDLSRWPAVAGEFYDVFGTTQKQGRVTFFDAYPAKMPALEPDLLNPHYGEYYRGTDVPPADYLRPVPTYFLTVGRGSQFQFAIAGSGSALNRAKGWLTAALTDLGIGGKTSAGYGFMRIRP